MPLKLSVRVNRKLGLPHFSSVGASCGLELELDATLLERDLEGFHSQVRSAYLAAHQAVHDELARLQTTGDSAAGGSTWELVTAQSRNGQHHARDNGPSPHAQVERQRIRRPATVSQIKAIVAIARRQEIDLPRLLHQKFQAERPEDLTIQQASALIGLLRSPDSA
jgi:hypothetical protein